MPTRRALMDIINKQRQWIEACEANGISYANGERGMAPDYGGDYERPGISVLR